MEHALARKTLVTGLLPSRTEVPRGREQAWKEPICVQWPGPDVAFRDFQSKVSLQYTGENELQIQPRLLGTNGESLLASVSVCHLKAGENHVWNKNVKRSLVVSVVGCNRYNDELIFFCDAYFYLALEIAVLTHGSVWTPQGRLIPKLKRRN